MTDKKQAQANDAKTADQVKEDQCAPDVRLDEIEPSGKYLAADGKTFVDANGEPRDEKTS